MRLNGQIVLGSFRTGCKLIARLVLLRILLETIKQGNRLS